MTAVYMGIGSNIEPRKWIPQALDLLAEKFGELNVSPCYACPAVGFSGADFINLVVGIETTQDPQTVLQALHSIEAQCARERGDRTASRSMDLDLLLYGQQIIDDGKLVLPRDDILRYAFVLKPLVDIAGNKCHPVDGRSYAQLWDAFSGDKQALQKIDLD